MSIKTIDGTSYTPNSLSSRSNATAEKSGTENMVADKAQASVFKKLASDYPERKCQRNHDTR